MVKFVVKKFFLFSLFVFLVVSCSSSPESVPTGDFILFRSAGTFMLAADSGSSNPKTWDGTIEYSFDGQNYQIWDGNEIYMEQPIGGSYTIYLRGEGNTVITGKRSAYVTNRWILNGSKLIYCYGDIRNLLNYSDKSSATMAPYCFAGLFSSDPNDPSELASAPDLSGIRTLSDYCYYKMFSNCEKLKSTVSLLPAETLTDHCYSEMFVNCKKMTSVPKINAKTLASHCCEAMFRGCLSITKPANIKSDVLTSNCFSSMYKGCENLATPPTLPSLTLQESCYKDMFSGCTRLKYMPDLPAEILQTHCYNGMFRDCSKIATLSNIAAKDFAENCFNGMFANCIELKEVYKFHDDSKLYEYSCANMYSGCEKLFFSFTKDSGYSNEFKIPNVMYEDVFFALDKMIEGTSGAYVDDPEPGQTLYTSNKVKR